MGYTPTLIWQLNRNLVSNANGYYYGNTRTWNWTHTSSFYLENDNVNQNCTRYPGTAATSDLVGFDWYNSSNANGDDGCGTYWEGEWKSAGAKPWHSWCSTSSRNIGEMSNFGYIGSYPGGFRCSYWDDPGGYTIVNPGDPTADILSAYGHGATGFTLPRASESQYRNSASLPVDGSSMVSSTGSVYSRPKGYWPVWYEIRLTSTDTVGSGNVKFYYQTHPPIEDIDTISDYRMCDAWMKLEKYWWNGLTTMDQMDYITGAHLGIVNQGVGDTAIRNRTDLAALVPNYLDGLPFDPRVSQRAMGVFTDEYYYSVFSSYIVIYSTKSKGAFVPMAHFDIAPLLSGSNKRIAGVAVQGLKLYVLTVGGELVLIDFTSTVGGSVTVLPGFTLPDSSYGFAGLVSTPDNSALWALFGTYSLNPWETTPSVDAPNAKLVKFTTGTQTWGTPKVCPTTNLRVGARDLNGLLWVGNSLVFSGDKTSAPSKVGIPGSTHTLMPRVAGTYSASGGTGGCIAIKINGRHLLSPSIPNAKFRFDWLTTLNATVQGAKVAWVPANSPVGTTWLGSEALTFATNPSFSLNTAGPVVSDPLLTHTMTRDNDYYLILWIPTTPISSWSCGVRKGHKAASWNSDQSASLTVPSGTYSDDAGWLFDGVVFDSPTDHHAAVIPDPTKSVHTTFKLVAYDTLLDTWVSQEVSQSPAHYDFDRRVQRNVYAETPIDAYLKSTTRMTLAKDKALFQGTLSYNSLFLYDPSTNTTTDLVGTTAFPPTLPTTSGYRPTVFIRNTACGTILSWTYQGDGPERKSFWTYNVWDDGDMTKAPDSVTTVEGDYPDSKALAWGHQFSYYGEYHAAEPWLSARPFLWIDNVLLTVMYTGVGDYRDHLSARYAFIRPVFMPRYYYWDTTASSWKVTTQRTKAEAKAKTIPDHNTVIPITDGLVLKFGPEAGSSFTAGEYHSLNATWGRVKYTRKARYSTAMFPGRTFTQADSRLVSDMTALKMTSFEATSAVLTNSAGQPVIHTVNSHKACMWAKRTSGAWTVDCNAGVWPVVTMTFDTPKNFSDINMDSWLARGITWEVSTDGSTFTPISPLWRSHNGRYWVFSRQENVVKVRLTAKTPGNYDGNSFFLGGCWFYDYGTQAQINQARLGSSGATDNTAARGSWDSTCLGVAPTITISIDGGSIYMNAAIPHNHVDAWYSTATVPANRFKSHPYYGFLRFEGDPSVNSTKTGTNLTVYYAWGKRV